MPETLGVPSLQDVCMQRFCLHLSELAITSDQILAEQTPQQVATPHGGESGAKETGQSSSHKTGQEDAQQAAKSDVTQETEQEAGKEYGGESAEHEQQHDAAPVRNEVSGKVEHEAGECRQPAVEQEGRECRNPGVEQEGGLKPLQRTGQGTLEDSRHKDGNDVEQEIRAYLLRNVPPCFFEQLMHDTLTIINKHFYNPKYKCRRPAMVAVTGWLLGDHVRHLSLDQCRMLCDRLAVPLVFRCLRHMPRLQLLAIGRLNFWKIPQLDLLSGILSGLPRLTALRLEYICLPEMVAGLAEKCPLLQELSLKDSEKVTDREVPDIRRCLHLRSLNISGTSVTGAGSWEILCALPSLTWFEHCPFNCNSGPFLFDSREAMLSSIWESLSPDGRAYSAQLPSVIRELALPPPPAVPEPAAAKPAAPEPAAPEPAAPEATVSEQRGAAEAGTAPGPGASAGDCGPATGSEVGTGAAGGAAAGAAAAGREETELGRQRGGEPQLTDGSTDRPGVTASDRQQQAATGSEQAATGSEQAATGSDQASTGSEQAATGSEQAATGSELAATGSEQAATGSELAATGSEQAATGSELAATESEQAATGSEQAATGSEQAAATPPSRESSVGTDGSSASSSGRHVSPLPLSRSGSGSGTPRRLRTENFWLFNPKTEEVALSRMCPFVRLLRLDFVFQDMGRSPELAGLVHLRHVTRLEINSFDRPRFSVLAEVLRQLGGQLTELALHVCDDYTATAALENAAARWCPRLERYSFTGDYSVRLPAERGDDDLEFGALRRRHPALRELTLGGFVTGRRLLFVLAHADGLRRLRLDGELLHLDDAGFRQLLAVNPLQQLQELWVNVSSGLTLQALLPLLFDPQCALRRLGRLSSLHGLDRASFIELRRQVRSLNLALELVWVTPGV